jgi:probable phosphoglycerate mutase
MKLIVIRHGQTTGDVEDRYGGAYDDSLSAEGKRQVETLATELAGKGIEAIFASPLLRAQETARILAGKVGCGVKVDPDLRERDQYGALTGMVKAEARLKHPDLVELVKNRLSTLPGAESYADASARMARGFERVAASGHDCAAIVWHGGGMRTLFRDILQKGEIQFEDCCWVELEGTPGAFSIGPAARLTFGF